MPIKKAAKKAFRQTQKRTARNLVVRDAYKKAVKDVLKAIENGGKDVAEKIRLAQKKLDKAAKRGVIKRNTAGRKLSRLVKKVKKSVSK